MESKKSNSEKIEITKMKIIRVYNSCKDEYDLVDYENFKNTVCDAFGIDRDEFETFMEKANLSYGIIENRTIIKFKDL